MSVRSPWSGRVRVAAFVLLIALAAGIAPFSAVRAQCSADPWADVVVASTSTTGDPAAVLGPPDNVLVDFENDGNDPGFVILAFLDDVIVDDTGDDFAIHVSDFAASEWPEAFELLVSPDGVLWASLGVVHPTSPFQNQPETFTFDLHATGLTSVTRVMILNTTADPYNNNEGVDLDSIEALHCVPATDGDLETCEGDLDTCSSDLLSCERELDDAGSDLDGCRADLQTLQEDAGACNDALGTCNDALGTCNGELGACNDALGASAAEMEQARAGVAEVRRLLELPPGRRSSDYACSGGEVCTGLMKVIEMLLPPPQNHHFDDHRDGEDHHGGDDDHGGSDHRGGRSRH